MRAKANKKHTKRINRLLEFPEEIFLQETKVTINGFKKMLIENYEAILEYQDFFIRIKTKIGIVNINGFNLKLNEMTKDDIMVIGSIDGIDFEKIEE